MSNGRKQLYLSKVASGVLQNIDRVDILIDNNRIKIEPSGEDWKLTKLDSGTRLNLPCDIDVEDGIYVEISKLTYKKECLTL